MVDGASLRDGVVHLVQLRHALVVDALDGELVLAVIVVDGQAVGGLANVARLATDDDETGVGLEAGAKDVLARAQQGVGVGAAEALGLLAAGLVEGGAVAEGFAQVAVALALRHVVGPGHQLCGHKVAVAVLDDGRRGVVLKLEVGDVVPGRGAGVHPLGDAAAYAAHHAAAHHADDVKLVRAVVVGKRPADLHIELVGHSGPEHEVHVGPAVDGGDPPQPARRDHPAHGAEPCHEAGRVTAEEVDAVSFSGLHHALGLLHGDGHGLLDDDVLAVLRRGDGVLTVVDVGRGDPDHVHVGVLAEGLDVVVGAALIALAEGGQGLRSSVSGCHDVEVGRGLHSPDHLHRAGAQAGDGHVEFLLGRTVPGCAFRP